MACCWAAVKVMPFIIALIDDVTHGNISGLGLVIGALAVTLLGLIVVDATTILVCDFVGEVGTDLSVVGFAGTKKRIINLTVT